MSEELPNYLAKIERLREQGLFPAGGLSEITVCHDDWCGSNRGERCDCDPDIYLGKGRDGEKIA